MAAFLFTDVESSTRLWELHPEAMRHALARHDLILRETVTGVGGEVVKSTGDGMLATFRTVSASLEAATAAQVAFASEAWATPEPIRVRMGIHAGDGELRDGDYFGPAVNRAARVMAAAHGGQVLVSGLAVAQAAERPVSEVGFIDLGVHRLKDLTLPEHLYQATHPELRSEFPPPATLDSRPHNIPMQLSEFFGRVDELATISLMLAAPGARLLTLTGPGGAGKTRLGLQTAAEHLGDFDDGVFFVDLAPETDPEAAYEAIARALGLPLSGLGTRLEVLESQLRDREMLLILDNFEQVTAAAAGVGELLQKCPGLKVLVTSREPLRIRGESVFPVPALALPHPGRPFEEIAAAEAVMLFVDRARTVQPGFELSPENAPTVAEICLRLDGLPLAIELAAARLNVFTPSDLMRRLRERLDVLGAGGRDLPARQRTLWGAISWSYELLDSRECEVFEMMSVFSPASLEQIEAVAVASLGDGEILDVLSSLVDKSLIRSVQTAGKLQFSMLQTIKEYAGERLAQAPDRLALVRRSHARFYTDHATRLGAHLRGERRVETLAELAEAVGNLRNAWRYWIDSANVEEIFGLIDSLWALHDANGWYHAAIELAVQALDVLAETEDADAWSGDEVILRTSLARALMAVQGYTPAVEEAFKRVLDMSGSDSTSGASRFPVLRALATYYLNIADFAAAADVGRELLELAPSETEHSFLPDAHYVLGASLSFAGDLSSGLPHLERAIELFDPSAEPTGRFRLGPNQGVIARTASGLLLWQRGALDQAVTLVDEAYRLGRELGHPFTLAYALFHHGLFDIYRGRFEAAKVSARELAIVSGDHQYAVWATLALVLEGAAITGLGDVHNGLALTEKGVGLYQGLTTPPVFWPLILAMRGLVFAAAGETARGLELVDDAILIIGDQDPMTPQFRLARADVLQSSPEVDSVLVEHEYDAAIRAARQFGATLTALQALVRIVQLRRRIGSEPDRSDELRVAYEAFTEGHAEHDLVVAAELLGL